MGRNFLQDKLVWEEFVQGGARARADRADFFFYSTDSTPVQNRSSSSTIPSRCALFGAAPVGADETEPLRQPSKRAKDTLKKIC